MGWLCEAGRWLTSPRLTGRDATALRTLDFRGGLDAFLVKAGDDVLSLRAQKIKRQVKAKLTAQPAA